MKRDEYISAYKKGYKILEEEAEKQGYKYFEIVEDTYEYKYGLLLIAYEDYERTVEIDHSCINLENI